MENHQLRIIEQQAEKLGLGQGEVMRIAHEITGIEVPTLFDLDRAETDQLIVALDSYALVGSR